MDKSVFGVERAEDSPGFLLWQTTLIWQRLIKATLEPYGLSHPQFVILAILMWFEEHDLEPTQVMMVNWSKLDKMTVSQSLKKLGVRGLVTRAEHTIDTRAKITRLTPEGKVLVRQLVPLVEGADTKFFGKVLTEEKGSLIRILRELVGETAI
jgi:DNA-binding MarR family transcriptional regulator